MMRRTMRMSENGIITYSGINQENLKRYDYTNSLTAEAFRVGLITEADMDNLRNELMGALAEIIGLYTMNESTSIKAETARELTSSLLFNIDTYLLTFRDHKKALEVLLDRKPYELYGKGYLINKELFESAKRLYGSVRLSRLKKASEAYNKTLDQYFHYYLTNYDPRFSAHSKIYITLLEYKISGSFHIDKAVKVLKRLLEINRGKVSDVVVTARENNEVPVEEE